MTRGERAAIELLAIKLLSQDTLDKIVWESLSYDERNYWRFRACNLLHEQERFLIPGGKSV